MRLFPKGKPGEIVPEHIVGIAGTPMAMLIFLLLVLLRETLGLTGRGGYDEVNYHKPTIDQFASQLPQLDFSDYLSATTPGYHVLLASITHFFKTDGAWVSAFFTALLVTPFFATSFLKLVKRPTTNKDVAIASLASATLILPLIASPYVLASGIWLLPDNLAWFFVAELLAFTFLCLDRKKFPLIPAILLFFLVAVRQIHLWAAAPIVVAAFCSIQLIASSPPPTRFISELRETLTTHLAKRIPFALLAALLTLPSVLLLYYFFNLWHGLTPPTFQGQYPIDASKPLLLRLFNAPAAPAFILALFGVFGVFYAGFWFPALIKSLKTRGVFPLLISALVLALLFALIPATTESIPLGRWSGLWQFTSKLPIIAGHTSTLILSLALLGAVTLCGFLTSMRASHAVVCFTAIAGFAAAQAASFQLWQRYNEPFILIMLILMTTIIIAQRDEKEPTLAPLLSLIYRLRFAGPAILAIALAALSYNTFKNAKPSEFFDLQPGTDRTKAFLKGDPSIKPVPLPTQNP